MGAREEVVVLDTNVLVSTLGWRGPERRVYELCRTGRLSLASSLPLLDELQRVLKYPKLGSSAEEAGVFLQDILAHASLFESDIELEVILDDPDDNRVLECALSAEARWIVSGDPHLLELRHYEGIKILKGSRAASTAGGRAVGFSRG